MPKSHFTPESRKEVDNVLASRHVSSPELIKRVMEVLEPKNVDNFRLKAKQYVDNHLRLKKETKGMADARRKKMAASGARWYHKRGGKEVRAAKYKDALKKYYDKTAAASSWENVKAVQTEALKLCDAKHEVLGNRTLAQAMEKQELATYIFTTGIDPQKEYYTAMCRADSPMLTDYKTGKHLTKTEFDALKPRWEMVFSSTKYYDVRLVEKILQYHIDDAAPGFRLHKKANRGRWSHHRENEPGFKATTCILVLDIKEFGDDYIVVGPRNRKLKVNP
ncbi:hypothetical protein NFJ02_18g29900 [Pycnococcus provasolii]